MAGMAGAVVAATQRIDTSSGQNDRTSVMFLHPDAYVAGIFWLTGGITT